VGCAGLDLARRVSRHKAPLGLGGSLQPSFQSGRNLPRSLAGLLFMARQRGYAAGAGGSVVQLRSVPACSAWECTQTRARQNACGWRESWKSGRGSLRVRPSSDNPTNPDIWAYAAEAGGSALRVIIHMPTRPRSVPACGGTAIIPRRTHAAGWSPESRAGARIARGEIRLCCARLADREPLPLQRSPISPGLLSGRILWQTACGRHEP